MTGDVEEVGCVGVFTDDFLDLLFPEWEQGNYTIAAKVSDGVLTVTLENDTI